MFPPDEKEEPCFFTYEHIDVQQIGSREMNLILCGCWPGRKVRPEDTRIRAPT